MAESRAEVENDRSIEGGNIMGKLKLGILGILLVGVAGAASADTTCSLPPGGGGVPNPFTNINQHVELAVGEMYSLVGTVVTKSSVPYLAIDLKEHPWLANGVRKQDPYYQLEGNWTF